jgi:DNA-binding MarR family transcriptional regulator
MADRLRREIRQARPFRSRETEVFLNVQRTAEHLMSGMAEVLKPFNLSPTQYNVLCILRGASRDGGGGFACGEIGDRMVTRDPDVTRLLDRLEARGLVSRQRLKEDRRVIRTCITDEGLKLVNALDAAVTELHRGQLGHLGQEKLRALNDLLEAARDGGRDGSSGKG